MTSLRHRLVRGAVAVLTTSLVGTSSAVTGSTAAAAMQPAVARQLPATAVCRVSGPLIAAVPYAVTDPPIFRAYVEFEANNGPGGVFAGVAFDGYHTFTVLSWRDGRTTVLDRFSYSTVSYSENFGSPEQASVRVVGVDASGAVIVAAQSAAAFFERQTYVGYRYDARGRRSTLVRSAFWTSTRPTSVVPNGSIVGQARTSTGWRPVEWSIANTGRPFYLTATAGYVRPVVDAVGDVAFQNAFFGWGYIRSVGGTTVYLGGTTPSNASRAAPVGAVGRNFVGLGYLADNSEPVLSWSVTDPAVSGRIVGKRVSSFSWLMAAGPGGDLVGQRAPISFATVGTSYLHRANGGEYVLPRALASIPSGETLPVTVDNRGVVVYTAPDGLPHFFYCTG